MLYNTYIYLQVSRSLSEYQGSSGMTDLMDDVAEGWLADLMADWTVDWAEGLVDAMEDLKGTVLEDSVVELVVAS